MSWEQLLSILDEAREERERIDPPTACPNDGEPLQRDPDGNLRCGFDGWVWDGLSDSG